MAYVGAVLLVCETGVLTEDHEAQDLVRLRSEGHEQHRRERSVLLRTAGLVYQVRACDHA